MDSKKLKSLFHTATAVLLFGAFLCNLALSWSAFSLARNRSVSVVTNLVEISSSPLPFPTNSVFSSSYTNDMPSGNSLAPRSPVVPSGPSKVADAPYQYFLVGRRIGVQMFGRYYYEGSPCSYGRIRTIFPDRIFLADGSWISNTFEDKYVASRRVKDVK